jgi:hypothetical protein
MWLILSLNWELDELSNKEEFHFKFYEKSTEFVEWYYLLIDQDHQMIEER